MVHMPSDSLIGCHARNLTSGSPLHEQTQFECEDDGDSMLCNVCPTITGTACSGTCIEQLQGLLQVRRMSRPHFAGIGGCKGFVPVTITNDLPVASVVVATPGPCPEHERAQPGVQSCWHVAGRCPGMPDTALPTPSASAARLCAAASTAARP